jgi:hypothetical protein
MIWEGLTRPDAAAKARLTDHALYCALRKSHVKAHYLAECETLRISGKSRRLHRLQEIVETSPNHNASVAAAKAIEGQDGGTNVSISIGIQAGYVIDLSGERMAHERGVSLARSSEITSADRGAALPSPVQLDHADDRTTWPTHRQPVRDGGGRIVGKLIEGRVVDSERGR